MNAACFYGGGELVFLLAFFFEAEKIGDFLNLALVCLVWQAFSLLQNSVLFWYNINFPFIVTEHSSVPFLSML